ncbi:coiled-coil domain-containing protein 183-like [Falco biarmicus]|uniref:coiled-coil domain-containing protein 183-like n=1 Tax=Falco biarmicus TaxID=345155 RepID=UPI0024BC91BE|nr:coiled-coil domain-containing protein 183-like [Falco biarmicus]
MAEQEALAEQEVCAMRHWESHDGCHVRSQAGGPRQEQWHHAGPQGKPQPARPGAVCRRRLAGCCPLGFLWGRPGAGGWLSVPALSCTVPTAPLCPPEQGGKFCAQPREEKRSGTRERLPRLCEAVQEDVRARGHSQQVAQEKLQADIYERVNTCNMLLHQVRQRRQVREELQRRLQQLQDAAMPDKRQQAQAQAICQLEKNIEKVLLKVHTGQKVTALYLAVRDVLRKELAHLPPHLDLLCKMAELYGRELQDMDLMALEACKAADRAKEDANRTRSRILAERARMYRSRATQEVSVDTGWRKDVYQRHLRAQERHELTVDSPTPASQDQLVGTSLEAVRSQMEHEARVTQKMQQAKAALQCSRIWDIPGRLLEQQKSSADLEQCIKEGEEKKRALAERLHELELNLAKLKFHQPSNTSRVLEEELRLKLQCQEARLEDMRAQMMRSKDVLLKCEEDIDSLFVRLQGITVPGQVPTWGWRELGPGHCPVVQQHGVETLGAATVPPPWLVFPTKVVVLSLTPGGSRQGHGGGGEAAAL